MNTGGVQPVNFEPDSVSLILTPDMAGTPS
jgi:hypothetical protein